MDQLHGRTAVVIGGGGGIGRGIVLALAGAGMKVVVADIEEASAAAVASEVGERGGTAVAATVDSTERASLDDLVAFACASYGGVDLLSNNVGVIADRRLAQASEADWAWFLEFNVMSIVRSVDVFLPALRARPDAHVVITSSMAGLLALSAEQAGGFHTGLYVTTKHALVGYAQMLRAELAAEGIGVSVLCPGLVEGNLSVTSARHRPARFGGPDPSVTSQPPNPFAMPSEAIGPMVVDGIKANRQFLFTHGDELIGGLLTDRNDRLMADLRATPSA